MEDFFTATSAICVTGLATVDTASFWSPFGQAVIMLLIQVGGFGVMTLATLIGLTVLGKLSLRSRLTAATEAHADGLGGVSAVLTGIVKTTFLIEGVVALLLTLRFWLGHESSLGDAVWRGVFHAVSSFNNAGFALYTDNLMGFVGDPWICLPIAAAIILGGLGFPVLRQLKRHGFDLIRWSMNTRLVVVLTPVFLVAGWVFIGAMHGATWLGMDVLMFIGGGPAGTAGGIKLTAFAVLLFIIWTEVRGDSAVHIFGKRLSRAVHRQAISVALLAVALVIGSTMAILLLSPHSLDAVLFEVVSAFGTVGLSTGITATLDPVSQSVLCFLMYVGRLGPITFASALALSTRRRLYELPKERPIIG